MATWAIGYDLDVKGMKAAKYTKSNVTMFYNSIRRCLSDNNFDRQKQLSVYASQGTNSLADAFNVCIALRGIKDADRFVKRLHLFRVEDFNDLLPLVSSGTESVETDLIEERIEEIFGTDE